MIDATLALSAWLLRRLSARLRLMARGADPMTSATRPAAGPIPSAGGAIPGATGVSSSDEPTPAGLATRRGIFVAARICHGCGDDFIPQAPTALLCAPCHMRRIGAA